MSLATQPPPDTNVPVEAFRFAADFTPGATGADGTVPFTALARTGNAVDHWYWGPCIHDFSGAQMAAVIPVDYAHCDDEALGLVNATAVNPEGLQCSGLLVPFRPDDKATEVIFKSGKGVPYQASIFFDPYSCVVEDVPAGYTTEVNGVTFDGPVTVFRQWELRGLALCMYGVDGGTNVGFSSNLSGKTAAVTRFTKGDDMSTKIPKAGAVAPKAGNLATKSKAKGKFADGDAEETDEEKKKREEGSEEEEATGSSDEAEAEGDTTKKKDGEASTKLSRKAEGKQFITAFGEQHGPTLFAKGFTFAEAQAEVAKLLRAENDSLKAEVAKFSKTQKSGTTPVTFGASGTPEVPAKFSQLGRIGRLAAGITLPGRS
jgi:hypothetical protein